MSCGLFPCLTHLTMKFIESNFFPKNLIKMRCTRFHTIYFINFAAESIWLVRILFSCRISKHWNQDQIYSLPRRLGCILVSRCNSPCNEIDRLFLGCIEGFFHWLSMIVVPILEFEHAFINIQTEFIALLIWKKILNSVLAGIFLLASHIQICNFPIYFSHFWIATVSSRSASFSVTVVHTFVLQLSCVRDTVHATTPAKAFEIRLFLSSSIFGSLKKIIKISVQYSNERS